MPRREFLSVVVICFSSISLIALAGCTPGGQFDPTEMFSAGIFNTKKKIEGTREPVFPNGVPGAETGVPPDLVKGYQPPPEKAADADAAAAMAAPAAAKPAVEAKPKPKPKPKVARATPPREGVRDKEHRPTPQTAQPGGQTAWPAPPPTGAAQSGQTAWPAPPPTGAAQSGQTAWPAPPPTGAAQSGQSIWPAPPPTGASQQAAQPAQPAQSIWPNPPAPSTYSH